MAAFAAGFVVGMSTKAKADPVHDMGWPNMDVRSYWEMTCYPYHSPTYTVAVENAKELIITSHRGLSRSYQVIDQKKADHGFLIRATGWGRTLIARFGPIDGALVADRNINGEEGGADVCSSDLNSGSE
jgi:hypothetical protein